MPQVSAELRWFLNATNVNDVDAFDRWFKSGTLLPGGGKKPREDVYAVDPSTDELGVKKREGKSGLEVKALVEPGFFSVEFGTRNATVQLWSKVTSNILTLPVDATFRRTTLKTRWLRMFDTATSVATEVKLGAGLVRRRSRTGLPAQFRMQCGMDLRSGTWLSREVVDIWPRGFRI